MLLKLQLPADVPQGVPLLVAYSGGADSRLLLSLTKDYGDAHGVPVYAAHLHHGIRGAEADRDLDFCRRTAAKLCVPLFEKQVDVPAMSRLSGQSLEAEARIQRYAFFRELMEAHGIPVLLTAHHADDQLETLLHRFLRGSGTRGMGGIPEVRPLSYGLAVRPLLSMTKSDILAACHEMGLDYVTDSTNDEPFTIRNRLRQEIIPALEAMSGQGIPQQAAGRLSRAAREDEDCLTALAAAELTACSAENGLSVSALRERHPAVAKRILSAAYVQAVTEAYGTPPDSRHTLTAVHLEALTELCAKVTGGASLHLPLLTADIRKGILTFLPPTETAAQAPPIPTPLPIGDTLWDDGRMVIRLELLPPPFKPLSGCDIMASAVFPADVLPLCARAREAGDIILTHGMHKKLKKLLCDKGVPPHLRDRLPLICRNDGQDPLWYPTAAFADGFLPPAEGRALRVSIIKMKISRKDDTYE